MINDPKKKETWCRCMIKHMNGMKTSPCGCMGIDPDWEKSGFDYEKYKEIKTINRPLKKAAIIETAKKMKEIPNKEK